jgi:hypothetical protein
MMDRRTRVALLIAALVLGAAAHAVTVRQASLLRHGDRDRSALVASAEHQRSAVAPVSQLVRRVRAHAPLWSLPVAGALLLVAFLAVWCSVSVRRRHGLTLVVATYRRRGPPDRSFPV